MLVMNKIEEILIKYKTHPSDLHLDDLIAADIVEMMKEYAEWYANQCLEIVAEKATIYYDIGGYSYIDQQSILNIKLPDHE